VITLRFYHVYVYVVVTLFVVYGCCWFSLRWICVVTRLLVVVCYAFTFGLYVVDLFVVYVVFRCCLFVILFGYVVVYSFTLFVVRCVVV